MSVLFAATYPDRITKLVLYGSFAKFDPAPDYFPETQGEHDAFLERIYRMVDSWGSGNRRRHLCSERGRERRYPQCRARRAPESHRPRADRAHNPLA
jgi:pimeloyl-ACP methyl ester carboxylesterase